MTVDQEATVDPPMPDGESQGSRYPGSPPFDDSELSRKLFRARADESAEVFHSIVSHDLFVLYAISGTGKTSLLRAGVMDQLRQREMWPVTIRLNDRDLSPIESIRSSLRQLGTDGAVEVLGVEDEATTMWDLLGSLEIWHQDVLQLPVLIFDQFEELFTLRSHEEQRAFITQFGRVARRSPPTIRVLDDAGARGTQPRAKMVLSMREDFLGELEAFSTDVPQILSQRYRLQPLSRAQARRAVVEPAAVEDPRLDTRPFAFEPEAVSLILDFLSESEQRGTRVMVDAVEAVQLQLICQHVEEVIVPIKRMAGEEAVMITTSDLGGSAGLRRILTQFYARRTDDFARADRKRIKRLCEQGLISRHHRRLSLEQGQIEQDYGVTQSQLELLVQHRLLRAEPRVGSVYYELAHDSLVAPIVAQREADRGQKRRRNGWIIAALSVAALVLTAVVAAVITRQVTEGVDLAAVNIAAFSPDDAQILTVGLDGTARTWDADTGDELHRLDHGSQLSGAGYSPDGTQILTVGTDGTARTWDADSGDERHLLDEAARVTAAAFRPDDTQIQILTASSDGIARTWDADSGMKLLDYPHSSEESVAVATYSPDGTQILTASTDATLRLWELDARFQPLGSGEELDTAAFSPDGELILTVSISGTARTLDAEDGAELRSFRHRGKVTTAAFNHNGSEVVTSGTDGTARTWHAESGEELHRLEHEGRVTTAAYNPDGTRILTVTTEGVAYTWDALTGDQLGRLERDGPVTIAVFSHEGNEILTGGADGSFQISSIGDSGGPEPTTTLTTTTEPPVAVAMVTHRVAVGEGAHTPILATGRLWVSDFNSATVSVVDPLARELVRTIPVGPNPLEAAFAAGHVWVPNSGEATLSLLDPEDLVEVARIPVGQSPSTPIEAAGRLWVSNAGSGTVSRIDLAIADAGSRADVIEIDVGAGPVGPTLAAGQIWVANHGGSTLSVIDPENPTNTAELEVGSSPRRPLEAYDRLWVPNTGADTVTVVDPVERSVVGTIEVGAGPRTPLATNGYIWIPAFDDDSIAVVDPVALTVVARIDVGDGPVAPVSVGDLVWVPHNLGTTMSVIDPASLEVVATTTVGARPRKPLVTATGTLWVPLFDDAELAVIEQPPP